MDINKIKDTSDDYTKEMFKVVGSKESHGLFSAKSYAEYKKYFKTPLKFEFVDMTKGKPAESPIPPTPKKSKK